MIREKIDKLLLEVLNIPDNELAQSDPNTLRYLLSKIQLARAVQQNPNYPNKKNELVFQNKAEILYSGTPYDSTWWCSVCKNSSEKGAGFIQHKMDCPLGKLK